MRGFASHAVIPASRYVDYGRQDAGRTDIGDIYPCISVIHLNNQTSMHRRFLALVVRSSVNKPCQVASKQLGKVEASR